MGVGKGGSDTNLEGAIFEKVADEGREVSTQAKGMEVSQDAVLPGCVESFFKVKKDGDHVASFNEGLSDEGLQADQVIKSGSRFSETALEIAQRVRRFQIPHEPVVYRFFKKFT